jgi:cytochrome c556
MRTRFSLITTAFVLLLAACRATQPAAPAEPQPEFRTTGTIKDIMDSIIDPAADELWGAVATTVDATGTHEKFPQNDEEWKQVRRNAIQLIEGSNLLQIPGRKVARPGEKSENPGIELEPEEMEKLINDDRAGFYKLAGGLHETVMAALKAIDARDKEALLDSGDDIDQACENCHVKYWYPNEAKTQQEVRQPPAPPTPAQPEKK